MHPNADREEAPPGQAPIRRRLAAGLLVFNAIAVPLGLFVLWQTGHLARSGGQLLVAAPVVAALSLCLLGVAVPRSG